MSIHEWPKQVPRIDYVDLHSLWIEVINGQMMLSEQHHELCTFFACDCCYILYPFSVRYFLHPPRPPFLSVDSLPFSQERIVRLKSILVFFFLIAADISEQGSEERPPRPGVTAHYAPHAPPMGNRGRPIFLCKLGVHAEDDNGFCT